MEPPLPLGKLDPGLLAALLPELHDASVCVGPGLGRDVAVVDAGGPRLLVLTADPVTFATGETGEYAVTVNVNDVATAGGEPRWLLATLLLPEGETRTGVEALQAQLRAACARFGISLVGGHTEVTSAVVRPVVSAALVGEVERERLVGSGGARPGDTLLLTRGAAVEATALLARELGGRLRAEGFEEAFLARCAGFLRDPGLSVLEAARAATRAARVHAMHDPTEGGVATALWELAEASDVDLLVESARVPVLPETRRLADHLGLDPLGLIASGALLLAVAPAEVEAVRAACAEQDIPCARVGRVAARTGASPRALEAASGAPLARYDQDELTRVL